MLQDKDFPPLRSSPARELPRTSSVSIARKQSAAFRHYAPQPFVRADSHRQAGVCGSTQTLGSAKTPPVSYGRFVCLCFRHARRSSNRSVHVEVQPRSAPAPVQQVAAIQSWAGPSAGGRRTVGRSLRTPRHRRPGLPVLRRAAHRPSPRTKYQVVLSADPGTLAYCTAALLRQSLHSHQLSVAASSRLGAHWAP